MKIARNDYYDYKNSRKNEEKHKTQMILAQNTGILFLLYDEETPICANLYTKLTKLSFLSNVKKVHIYLDIDRSYLLEEKDKFEMFIRDIIDNIVFVQKNSGLKIIVHFYKNIANEFKQILKKVMNERAVNDKKEFVHTEQCTDTDTYSYGNNSFLVVGYMRSGKTHHIHFQKLSMIKNRPTGFEYFVNFKDKKHQIRKFSVCKSKK